MTPPAHRDRHGRDQVQLFGDLLRTGTPPVRLWVAAAGDLVAVSVATTDRRRIVSHLARIALYPLSALNAAAGIALAGVALLVGDVPAWVAVPALCVAIQGGSALGWLADRLPARRSVADVAFATGEAIALVAGAVGVVAAILTTASTGDAEYGPATMTTLVLVHAAVGLLAAGGERSREHERAGRVA